MQPSSAILKVGRSWKYNSWPIGYSLRKKKNKFFLHYDNTFINLCPHIKIKISCKMYASQLNLFVQSWLDCNLTIGNTMSFIVGVETFLKEHPPAFTPVCFCCCFYLWGSCGSFRYMYIFQYLCNMFVHVFFFFLIYLFFCFFFALVFSFYVY